ncbi:hypothetical protein [Paeniglutamicibacter sp. NPDC091659]|uniref:hypothetical protein n=1 Tax=Paeniglutamicibacter sp. NPDC091659 TaxID=3364389 RepID=UPI003806DBB4
MPSSAGCNEISTVALASLLQPGRNLHRGDDEKPHTPGKEGLAAVTTARQKAAAGADVPSIMGGIQAAPRNFVRP